MGAAAVWLFGPGANQHGEGAGAQGQETGAGAGKSYVRNTYHMHFNFIASDGPLRTIPGYLEACYIIPISQMGH